MPFVTMEANWEYNDNTYDQSGFKPVKIYMTREKAVEAIRKAERVEIATSDAITLGYGRLDPKTVNVLKRVEPAVMVHSEKGLPEEFKEDPDRYMNDHGLENLVPFVGRAVELMTDDEVEHMLYGLEIELFRIEEVEMEE